MYYEIVGESRNSYARLVFLNELAAGQDLAYIADLLERSGEEPLRFDPAACWVCLLGLRKSVYSGVFGLSANDYMQLYVRFEAQTLASFEAAGFRGEVFLHLYGDKQIVLLFSGPGAQAAAALAQDAQDRLQEAYRLSFLSASACCCQTCFLEEPVPVGILAPSVAGLASLSKLGYFLMEPRVLSARILASLRRVPADADVSELSQALIQALGAGDADAAESALDALLLDKAKYSFDAYLLKDLGTLLKRSYRQLCSAYDIPLRADLDLLMDDQSHLRIEDYARSLARLFREAALFVAARGRRYGRVTQRALQIIKASYCKWDISLTYVASQVGVSPAYLSSVFNHEVGMNIARYITDLRLEKALTLLRQDGPLVGEIAAAVGFSSKRYFSEMFKAKLGMTPTEYRDRPT